MRKTDTTVKDVVNAWGRALTALPPARLDRVLKSAARFFDLDKDDADYQAALVAERSVVKARFIMSIDPLFTDEGLVAFLIENARRWDLEIPEISAGVTRAGKPAVHASAKTPRARRERPAVEAVAARVPKAERVPHKGTGAALEVVLRGNAMRLAEAMGFRKTPDASAVTVMRKNARFALSADPAVGLVARTRASDLGSVLRFVRKRLATQPQHLGKVLITTRKGDVPELDARVIERAALRRTSKGFRLQAVA